MTLTSVDKLADLFARPPDEIPDALREHGLLPDGNTVQPVPREALNAPAIGPVFAHIDPGQLHVDDRADALAFYVDHLTTSSPALTFGHDAIGHLYLLLEGLGPKTDAVASVTLLIFDPVSTTVYMSATGNPVTMTVTRAATGGQAVTVQVPFTSTQQGWATVQLRSYSQGHRFRWYGTDVRKL